MNTYKRFFCLAFLLISACQYDETSGKRLDNSSRVTLAVQDEAKIPGFARADRSQSPVKLGAELTERSQGDFRYWEGPMGSFSKNVRTGISGANTVDTAVRDAPPFGKSLEEHNAFVLEKFLESGLPAEQVDQVDGTVETTELGETDKELNSKVTGFISFIRRKIDGIPVPDSVAMARYNDQEECIIELVYWPEIASSVVEEAKAMNTKEQIDKIRSMVPTEVLKEEKESRVVIHHKFGASKNDFEAWASYDVTSSKGEAYSFDFDGRELKKDKFQ